MGTSFVTVPCYNCICVPICKNKSFHDMYLKCDLIRQFFGSRSVPYKYKYTWIEDILKPTTWCVDDGEVTRIVPKE